MAAYYTRRKPTFWVAFWPLLTLVAIAYVRDPRTNYIFDEQEALLGNPYVNQTGFAYSDAIYRDFWGLPANARASARTARSRTSCGAAWSRRASAARSSDERAPPAVMKLIAEKIAPEPVPTPDRGRASLWFQDLTFAFPCLRWRGVHLRWRA
jgi:hypothetical protein